jgi:oligoribonuclease NrnB/cAMP/cGMP phosphodiesterase (DHH superfamily)
MKHGPGKRAPSKEEVAGKQVVVVDFCFEPEDTLRLARESGSFLVLDHHASAEEALTGSKELAAEFYHFENRQSGATLAWNYFHPPPSTGDGGLTPPPDDTVPLLLRYVEDKDLWRWALQDSAAFTAGLSTVPQTFAAWDAVLAGGDGAVDAIIDKGKAVLQYKESVVQQHVRSAVRCSLRESATDAAAAAFRGMVVNSTTLASEIGNALCTDRAGVDFALIWSFEHDAPVEGTVEAPRGSIRVSLRSNMDAVDVSRIARFFGGGGHRRAAGFTLKGVNDIYTIIQ